MQDAHSDCKTFAEYSPYLLSYRELIARIQKRRAF